MAEPAVQWFDTVDVSRDGNIDVKELQRALQLGNLNFSLQAVAQMIRYAAALTEFAVTSLARCYPLRLCCIRMNTAGADSLTEAMTCASLADTVSATVSRLCCCADCTTLTDRAPSTSRSFKNWCVLA